ncbi:MAG: UDP binding domain-containing protein [Acidiferrobacter sp.]
MHPRLTLAETPINALEGADALAIVTEWKVFRGADFNAIKSRLRSPVIFDGPTPTAPAGTGGWSHLFQHGAVLAPRSRRGLTGSRRLPSFGTPAHKERCRVPASGPSAIYTQ